MLHFVRIAEQARWASIGAFADAQGVDATALPRSVRIILEAALVGLAEGRVELAECAAILRWTPGRLGADEWRFPIGRVLMQDAAGLPLLADLAALRDAVGEAGGDPRAVDLTIPAALVIDHSVDTDRWGARSALAENLDAEFRRNGERYAFARWAEQAFKGLTVIPPGQAIVHQAHLEQIAEVVTDRDGWRRCDTVIGADSHTTMVNGLGVLGWGVGGIEAEAALLGRTMSIASPEIVGVELVGRPAAGVFGSDLALRLTARLRQEGVVGAFLEFYGPGVGALDVTDRCTIANMAPEYGATLALFPVDRSVLAYLARHGRDGAQLAKTRRHLARQGLFGAPPPRQAYDRVIRFDLAAAATTAAGPSRPDQSRALDEIAPSAVAAAAGRRFDGRVVLAAITSCTNTANLRSMAAAGLLAAKASARGLQPPPWVKTVLAPGSQATTQALARMSLLAPLERLGFHVAAYGCGPCVGNSGSLAPGVEDDLSDGAVAAAVLSGNRNFEGRIHPAVRAAYLMSPALVVAYALAGRIDVDLTKDAVQDGVMLSGLWPSEAEIQAALGRLPPDLSVDAKSLAGLWPGLSGPTGPRFPWTEGSSFFVRPPFFGPPARSRLDDPITGAAPLLLLGDSVTTDHISPVGAIAPDSAAAHYLVAHGTPAFEVGAYSARRVNHEVMLRGTFGSPRLANRFAPAGGPHTRHMNETGVAPIHEVARRYADERRPVVVLAGRDYGAGSARDWAAKGTALLGVRAVLARSFERIHRSNLVALGVLPIEVVGSDDPWRGIRPGSAVTVSIGLAPGAPPNSPAKIDLVVDGRAVRLSGVLRVLTGSERRQLQKGTVFDACLTDALAGAAEHRSA